MDIVVKENPLVKDSISLIFLKINLFCIFSVNIVKIMKFIKILKYIKIHKKQHKAIENTRKARAQQNVWVINYKVRKRRERNVEMCRNIKEW